MRKTLTALCCLALAGTVSALTCNWSWTANGTGWQDFSTYYLVYSEGQLTAAEAVAAANRSYSGNDGTWGGSFDMSAALDSLTGKNYSYSVSTGKEVSSSLGEGSSGTSISLNFADKLFPGKEDFSGAEGYLYLVIFDQSLGPGTNEQFAVAQAGTGKVQIDDEGQVVGPGPGGPDSMPYYVPVFMAGTSKAAPEPTALALLALGIAGVALRRRVR